MILRLFACQNKPNEKTFIYEQQFSTRQLHPSRVNFTSFFHLMLRQIRKYPPPEFENKKVCFEVFRIEYWTNVDDEQKFHQINIPFFGNPEKLPFLIKRGRHHLVDLHVHYSILKEI